MAVMKIIVLFVCLAIPGIIVETIGARLKRASGGKAIPIHLAPYFVSLKLGNLHVCGGAFISRKHVLTAARCIGDDPLVFCQTIRVVSGTDGRHGTPTVQLVNRTFVHPGYEQGNQWCDVAVIRLAAPVEWSMQQSFIALPETEPTYFSSATLTSFQTIESEYGKVKLRQFQVYMLSIDLLHKPTGGYEYTFYGSMGINGESNTFDDGAPLVHNRRIVGIASQTIRPDFRQRYYVNVFKFKTFIENSKADVTP